MTRICDFCGHRRKYLKRLGPWLICSWCVDGFKKQK